MIPFLKVIDEIPVRDSYDVIVVGGGVAGVAAAIAAGRRGAKTLLIEKSVLLGGLATLGYVIIYLPLCDGEGHRLVGGISEELLWLSIKNSYDSLPDEWRDHPDSVPSHKRYQTVFNAPSFALHLDQVVQDAGVDVLFDTAFCKTVMEGSRCSHIIVENRDGRSAFACSTVVDATGDCSVFASAGAQTLPGDNFLTLWGHCTDLDAMKQAVAQQDISKAIKLLEIGADCNGKGHPSTLPFYHGTTARETTEFVLQCHAESLKFLEKKDPRTFAVTGLPCIPNFRTIRTISGVYRLRFEDAGCRFGDAIGCCGDWRKSGICFEVPYRCLVYPDIDNIVAAGRIIANADREAWEVTRVIPVAALTGEAAGISAVLQCDTHRRAQQVNINELQREMKNSGNRIHLR